MFSFMMSLVPVLVPVPVLPVPVLPLLLPILMLFFPVTSMQCPYSRNSAMSSHISDSKQ